MPLHVFGQPFEVVMHTSTGHTLGPVQPGNFIDLEVAVPRSGVQTSLQSRPPSLSFVQNVSQPICYFITNV